MCLARPGKVIEIKENTVILDYGNEKREVKTTYLKPEIGEYVIVNSGQVIQKISEKEAKESINCTLQ
ncbi:MAG: HypC/HybG/HupF family hydrogenase formation chaperone [archaeon]